MRPRMPCILALAVLVLPATAPASGPAAVRSAPLARLAQYEPEPWNPGPRRPRPERDTWYIGFGLGLGNAYWTRAGQETSFADAFSDTSNSTRMSLVFDVGWTVSRATLLGVELAAMRQSASYLLASGQMAERGLQMTNLFATVTYFPFVRGLFVKGGLGLANLMADWSVGGQVYDESADGWGWQVGIGYALWLGRSFNLTLTAEHVQHRYDEGTLASEARFNHVWLGCMWY